MEGATNGKSEGAAVGVNEGDSEGQEMSVNEGDTFRAAMTAVWI
jgi:hypothetical protein